MRAAEQELGSRPLGRSRAAEETHSPWECLGRSILHPPSGGRSTADICNWHPQPLQSDPELLEDFQGSFLLAPKGSRPVSCSRRKPLLQTPLPNPPPCSQPPQILNTTSVSISLPAIGRELDIPQSQLQWLVSAYALSSVRLVFAFYAAQAPIIDVRANENGE